METEAYQPRVMYAPDGKTRRTDTLQLETALKQQGWEFTPFPPLPEPAKPRSIQEQIDELRDLVAQHDAILMRGKPKKKEDQGS